MGDVASHVRRVASLERELALAEMGQKAQTLKPAAALGAGAAILGLLGAGMAAATAAALLALVLPWWAALMIVSAVLLLLAGVLAAVTLGRIRAAAPLMPETAIHDARETVDRVAERVA